ncbi:MAG: hypothetical protein CMJ89_17485 [Planctomycetes bacterium]|nr:hypothetical protein [Planctomycetota bacterium]
MVHARVTLGAGNAEEVRQRSGSTGRSDSFDLEQPIIGEERRAPTRVVRGRAVQRNVDLRVIEGGAVELDSLIGHDREEVDQRLFVGSGQEGLELEVQITD